MTIGIMIHVDEHVNEALKVIAKRHRRSKRQEIVVAIEQYVERGGQPVNTTVWHPGAAPTFTDPTSRSVRVLPKPPGDESA